MEPRKTASRGASRAGSSVTDESIGDVAGELDATRADASGAEGSSGRGAGLVGKVKERASAQLSAQKDRATDGLGTIVQAVRQTSDRLRDDQQDTIARYVESTAVQLERFADTLRDKNVDELLQDVQRLARRQPALFVGGSFALGLLAARFLKSSQTSDGGIDASASWNTRATDRDVDYQRRGAY